MSVTVRTTGHQFSNVKSEVIHISSHHYFFLNISSNSSRPGNIAQLVKDLLCEPEDLSLSRSFHCRDNLRFKKPGALLLSASLVACGKSPWGFPLTPRHIGWCCSGRHAVQVSQVNFPVISRTQSHGRVSGPPALTVFPLLIQDVLWALSVSSGGWAPRDHLFSVFWPVVILCNGLLQKEASLVKVGRYTFL